MRLWLISRALGLVFSFFISTCLYASTPEELKQGHFQYLLHQGSNLELLSEMSPKDQKLFRMIALSAKQELGLVTEKELSALKNSGIAGQLGEKERFLLAKIFIRNNDCKEGLKYLKGKGLKLDPETQAERAYYRATCFITYGHHNFAGQALSNALEGEWAATAYYNLATDYLNTKRSPKKALISLRIARDINTQTHESAEELSNRINLSAGSIYLDNEKPDLANDFFDQIPLDSRYVTQALYLSGLAKSEKRDYRGAIQVWRANLKHALIQPGVVESLLALPLIQRKTGFESQALESYVQASTLIDEEISTLKQFSSQIKKHGVQQVLFEDPESNDLEWYLDRSKAKNTQRVAYLNHLANQKELRDLMSAHFQLLTFKTRLTQSQARMATHKRSLTSQLKRIDKALKTKGHEKWVSRSQKLEPAVAKLKGKLNPALSAELLKKVGILTEAADSIERRLKKRKQTISKHLKRHSSLNKQLTKKLKQLNALSAAHEKALTQASLTSLDTLQGELVKRYEEAELGLIGILDALARLRTKRTNLLDGRYQ